MKPALRASFISGRFTGINARGGIPRSQERPAPCVNREFPGVARPNFSDRVTKIQTPWMKKARGSSPERDPPPWQTSTRTGLRFGVPYELSPRARYARKWCSNSKSRSSSTTPLLSSRLRHEVRARDTHILNEWFAAHGTPSRSCPGKRVLLRGRGD